MKLGAITWATSTEMVAQASKKLDFVELKLFPADLLREYPEKIEEVLNELKGQDVVFLHRSTEGFWDQIEDRIREIRKEVPIICIGYDPSYWSLSTVKLEIVATCQSYVTFGGEENFSNMLRYIAKEVTGMEIEVKPPKKLPWEGIYHPNASSYFDDVDEYLKWYREYKPKEGPKVGLLYFRNYWVDENIRVEEALIRALEEQDLDVIPAFSYSVRDEELGSKGSAEIICEYFLKDGVPRIDALVNLQWTLLGNDRGNMEEPKDAKEKGIEVLKKLGVPVFQPIDAYYKTIEEWKNNPEGLTQDIAYHVAFPEFEGRIEPIIAGAKSWEKDLDIGASLRARVPLEDRCHKIARRIKNWIRLKKKPIDERKVSFIFHNNPCASVEATVGLGAHLDTLESVARIIQRMKEVGYKVAPPQNGKELIDTIMERKAISEFRWTTVDEIVNKGGALSLISTKDYESWFNTLSPKVKERMNGAWGEPPGREVNGVPAAMVYDGKIVVTGVQYGNAVVCVQPKRGCAGARCDGRVCKILHDPDIPPPHQYMATYRYLEKNFGDVIIHVGTHGNLEFLPGKGVGLSAECYPDIGIGDIPHLYIYNADNPPEGTIAKRRSYATLVDHMQTVMMQGGLYEELEELDRFLGEYEQIKNLDPGRAAALEHLIMEAIKKTNLDKEIKINRRNAEGIEKRIRLSDISENEAKSLSFDEIACAAHLVLSRTRNTQIQDGMHIFGQLPEGERRVEFINSILRYDAGEEVSLRKIVSAMMGMNLSDLLTDGGKVCPYHKRSYGELLEEINTICKEFIRRMINNEKDLGNLANEVLGGRLKNAEYIDSLKIIWEKVTDLNRRIDESQEIEALLAGFDSGYIPPGPSGLITRGRDDILPTGRNFYSLDPYRIPSKAAWKVGQKLAEAVIEKYKQEEGRIPENVAIYWMCNDIMWSDGEGMAQILYLLGVKPIWLSNGRVKGFEIIPLKELERPRIDVTIRVSGITRDNFPNCIELVDEAIQAVASLPEPEEMNFVRKHSLAQLAEAKESEGNKYDAWRNATLRVFASKPGTYQAGTQLAVYASAWKDEKDLSDVFIYWNGYAYGKGIFGEEKHKQLAENLKTVDITYNKVVSDEYDLFGCCCYFGTHGGMTAAARHISGKEVKTYYGDTREPEHIEVRDMADEIRRVVRTKLLNPKWIEGMKQHGYKGAGDISQRIGRVYGWEATTQEVDDWIFDDIAKTFCLNEENRKFFEENNPWALEEIERRLLEAAQRGLWKADEEVLQGLKEAYLKTEGLLEERMGEVEGDFQGGSVDILTSEEVKDWDKKMKEVKEVLYG
ncbi:MAG: cobaltochelatase subunit CobN [bacterium]